MSICVYELTAYIGILLRIDFVGLLCIVKICIFCVSRMCVLLNLNGKLYCRRVWISLAAFVRMNSLQILVIFMEILQADCWTAGAWDLVSVPQCQQERWMKNVRLPCLQMSRWHSSPLFVVYQVYPAPFLSNQASVPSLSVHCTFIYIQISTFFIVTFDWCSISRAISGCFYSDTAIFNLKPCYHKFYVL